MSAPLLAEENFRAPAPQRSTIYNGQSTQATVVQSTQRPRVYAYTPKIVYSSYHSKQSTVLGSIQIIVGAMSIIFNSVAISYESHSSFFGTGIWSGILLIICGSFGIAAAKSMSKCKIITFMVLCILSSIAAGFLFLFSISGALTSRLVFYYQPCSYQLGSGRAGDETYMGGYERCQTDLEFTFKVRLTMNILLCLLAVLELIVCIWGSVIGCKVACCCSTPAQIVLPPECIALQGTSQCVVLSQQPGGQVVASYSAAPGQGNQVFQNQYQHGSVFQQGGYPNVDSMPAGAVGGAEITPPPMYASCPPPYVQEKMPLP